VFLLADAPELRLPPAIVNFDQPLNREQGELVLAIHSLTVAIDKIFNLPTAKVRRVCPWKICRYHGTNLCEGHLNPPSVSIEAESRCSFPTLLQSTLSRTLCETFELLKVGEKY
jgi:hypothetical protein